MAENKSFALMSDKAQIAYIFTIVLADDDGRLKGDSEWLRIKIFPYNTKISTNQMRGYLKEMVDARLITWYKKDAEYFIQHPNWTKFQILRPDRKKVSDIPPPNDGQMTDKRPRNISKRSKVNINNIILPDWIDKEVWKDWENHREEIGKPITPTAMKRHIKFLESERKDYKQIIAKSINSGWRDLYKLSEPTKLTPREADKARAFDKMQQEREEEREREENAKNNDMVNEVNKGVAALLEKTRLA